MTSDRWFAFLRAINTGNRRLTNEQLLAPFKAMGLADVAAYQAAGNITFTSSEPQREARFEQRLAEAYGFEVPTFLRSASHIATVVNSNVFTPAEIAATAGKVQVAFLRTAPSAETIDHLAGLVPSDDLVRVVGREWYWLPNEGISGSSLPVGQVEALLGPMTIRTLGTVARMSTKFGG